MAPLVGHGGSGIVVEGRDDLFLIPDLLEDAMNRPRP